MDRLKQEGERQPVTQEAGLVTKVGLAMNGFFSIQF